MFACTVGRLSTVLETEDRQASIFSGLHFPTTDCPERLGRVEKGHRGILPSAESVSSSLTTSFSTPEPSRCFSRGADVATARVYNVLRTLADTVTKLFITLFDKLSFGPISQFVYLLLQR